MSTLSRLASLFVATTTLISTIGCASTSVENEYFELSNLPGKFNSPASFAVNNNDILFSSPNLHNDTFVKAGLMASSEMPTIGLIDENDQVTTWYQFQDKDVEAKSGVVTPMGIAFGPDGHLYVADMQLWFGGESRILRIIVENNRPKNVEVVAKGLSFPNAVAWHGDSLYVSDTVLSAEKGKPTISGVYRFKLDELSASAPLQVMPFENARKHDSHLISQFTSDGSLGFGANGLAIDGQGNMYTGIMEEGAIYRTQFDSQGKVASTTLLTKGLVAGDGIQWDAKTNALYTTDLFDNAVYRISLNGDKKLLARNGNTDGRNNELDGPGEAILREGKVYVTNFDAAFGAANMVNTTPDFPITISVLRLAK
ncbi:hypothetical protein KUC3_13100 [Alteromonas sp. KC3]|uniref:SMP-30/gluconolactonase/LRE family protein n=1 Tax=unclassified Alteromonas TaxID=2614992 RepID=UPI00192069BB|nr:MULTISPECIES: hypothetical protein [unclassified Alteromonas]BCO18453.1 hypothetical protein KUC3_13100 [Alteromonas sp. KC3]BCO22414.1 hypothetical protein KUC14_12830 [Alteromonas sp. KC14]